MIHNFRSSIYAGLLIITFSLSCTKQEVEYSLNYLEIPSTNGNQIVPHYAYTLQYNETYEQADWVAYVLTREEAESTTYERTNIFLVDPDISTNSANADDYSGSGYDRGHLAPAGDMRWSETAMAESFYYSNMSPQMPGFNRGKWSSLEDKVRDWASEYGKLYIVTGGILNEGLPKIGPNDVAVPQYFYKVLLDYDNKKAIGFLMKNESLSESLGFYATSIDEIETLSGIDFFFRLPDSDENSLENHFDLTLWGL